MAERGKLDDQGDDVTTEAALLNGLLLFGCCDELDLQKMDHAMRPVQSRSIA